MATNSMGSDKDLMVIEIGSTLSQSILEYSKKGYSPEEVMRAYVNSVGVGLSILWKESTSSDIHKICGGWGEEGFLESNFSDIV